jgi:hypothetical protein
MCRILWLGCLPIVFAAVGCSNRPLVGMMDCFFPSRGGTRPPADLPRPTDRDPLPPVPEFDPSPPRDGFRRGDLPPLGAPIGPDGRRPTESEVPFTREPAPGAMPLPGGGRL